MRKMSVDERFEHLKKMRSFEKKVFKLTEKFLAGDITMKRYKEMKAEIRKEEVEYVTTSGIFLYYGQLFVKEVA